jgi:toxin ParE1/3/4
MAKFNLSIVAKEDIIRIHQSGIKKFGIVKANNYIDSLFEYFDIIVQRPFSFESVDFIKLDIGFVYVALIVFIIRLIIMQ